MKIILIFLCFALTLLGCKKSTVGPYKSQGTITGYDLRECPTPGCGGLVIIIKNDTAKNAPSFYLINSTLPQLGINADTKFPINVSLNYKPDTGIFAGYNYILVSQIKVIN